MKKILITLLALWLSLTLVAQNQCVLRGEVVNRNSKYLMIRKISDGFNSFLNNPIRIPIKKEKFEYTLVYAEQEAYELIFEEELKSGSWRGVIFFPTNGVVEFKLFPANEWERVLINGGELNAQFSDYLQANDSVFATSRNQLMKVQDLLMQHDEYDSREYKATTQELKSLKPDDHDARVLIYQKRQEMEKTHARYTLKAKERFLDPYDSLMQAELVWKYTYIRRHPSIMSYFLVWVDVDRQMKAQPQVGQFVASVFPLLKSKYPEHIYSKLIEKQIAGLRSITVGSKYIDIKAPSIDGDTVQLSDVVQNHISLINLWGSWCGPCIAKSRLLVPIYEQYQSKGFEVVGIAREFKNTDAVKSRISKERFTWLNLVDLDDRLGIWNTYGISNGAGLMVLVEADGTILAVDPKVEELERILKEKLH